MLAGAIAGVDERHLGDTRGPFARARLRMSHDDEIRVGAHHANRVLERLALLHRRVLLIHVDDGGAETLCGRAKRALGARARLEEHLGDDARFEQMREVLVGEDENAEIVRQVEERVQRRLAQMVHRDQARAVE